MSDNQSDNSAVWDNYSVTVGKLVPNFGNPFDWPKLPKYWHGGIVPTMDYTQTQEPVPTEEHCPAHPGETWYIRMPNSTILSTCLVEEVTLLTVLVSVSGTHYLKYRYKICDIEFVEKVEK